MWAGLSAVQVLRGEAGVGKTAWLEYLAEPASGRHIVRAAGVQSEMELAGCFGTPRPVERFAHAVGRLVERLEGPPRSGGGRRH